jgi:DNA repair protein RecN (Recombination protein N)
MLSKLSVRNYALIKELDLELGTGLTIITGETGAGKSILLGALSLILGARADSAVLLDKEEKCVVEGAFDIRDYELEEFFSSNDLDYEPVSILRREINPAGKSRAFVNDTPVTVNVLKELGEKLIDIHSQHQTLMLNDNRFQISIIDSFTGNSAIRNDYRLSYLNYRKLLKQYDELRERADRNKADLEYYRFQYAQLEEAKLRNGEQEELEKEQELLDHAEEIKSILSSSSRIFSGDEISVVSMLREIRTNLGRIGKLLPSGESLVARLESAYIEIDDLAAEVDRLAGNIEFDPDRLKTISNRLDTLYSLIQKHRVKDCAELITRMTEIGNIIGSIVTGDERLAGLEKELDTEKSKLASLATEISGSRRKALKEIELRVEGLLKQLGMPNARFRIVLSPTKDFTPSGTDAADFLFSANRQVEPESLSKTASGGELSRVMLSLKSLLSQNNNLPTIIFDEIDSGVSGEVADKVGQILSGMGRYMQVVNITHLPQVAARGKRHFHVYKVDAGDSTITSIKLLSQKERLLEVARLLSGSEVTETAIRNAGELLKAGAVE